MSIEKVLNTISKTLFYLSPGLGSIELGEDLIKSYSFHEELIRSAKDGPINPELKNYILKKSFRENVVNISLILAAKLVFSYLLSSYLNSPLFPIEFFGLCVGIYDGNKNELNSNEKERKLLELFE